MLSEMRSLFCKSSHIHFIHRDALLHVSSLIHNEIGALSERLFTFRTFLRFLSGMSYVISNKLIDMKNTFPH